ncbi:huntingtin-associated protein 1 [Prionailurus iriomotensis]
MPSLGPATRTRSGLASYSEGPLVPGPLAWGLRRRRASGRRRLPTSDGGLGCRAPSTPPLFGSWRKVSLRDDLLQLYSDSEEEEEEEEEEEPEEEEQPHYHSYGAPEPTCLRQTEVLHDWPQLEALQEQLRLLEEENEQLREELMGLRQKLQQQLASERVIQMRLQHELQDLQEKYTERGGMLTQAQEEVKTLCQQAPGSTDPVPRYTHAVPLGNHGKTEKEEMSHLGYRLCCSEVREQDRGLEAEKGLLTAEDFVAEDFVPVEELVPEEEPGATAEVASAEEGATEEAELVSEEAEAWEEVEPELDEATQGNVVTSALEASGLGPSRLNMKRVLQQLANWLDARYSRQLRLKMLQKGEGFAGSQQPSEAPQTA